jgi:DNA-binding response OmpR family regulator
MYIIIIPQQGNENKLSYNSESSNSKYWKGTRILLVDNEPEITSTLSIGLQDEGFAVDVFNGPLLALSNFKAGMYGLAILDINMPKMNGYELYQAMKKSRQ